nr:hypothetical protein [Sulfurimonas sp. SAG-AH-194-C20]
MLAIKIDNPEIEYECDDVALTHIKDSAKYIHDLRRKNRYE